MDLDDLEQFALREVDEDRAAGEWDDTPAATQEAPYGLPALALDTDGRIIAPGTGEVLDEAAAADALAETLRTYARAKVQADACYLTMQDARDDCIAVAELALAGDVTYQARKAELENARDTMATIQASLDGLFAGRDGRHPVKVDMGDVMVSWGKARETVTLAHPASWYATRDAFYSLAERFQRHGYADEPEDASALAGEVIAWLSPTTKTGELPGASITVRAGKGGAM